MKWLDEGRAVHIVYLMSSKALHTVYHRDPHREADEFHAGSADSEVDWKLAEQLYTEGGDQGHKA